MDRFVRGERRLDSVECILLSRRVGKARRKAMEAVGASGAGAHRGIGCPQSDHAAAADVGVRALFAKALQRTGRAGFALEQRLSRDA